MRRLTAMAFASVALVHVTLCENQPRSVTMKEQVHRPVTGNLRIDLFGQSELADVPHFIPTDEVATHSRKSPFVAVGLSLVVPGAGQFYTERYWETAAFFAADVAAWVLAYHYDKKGDKQTDVFQTYADGHWNVVQYALFSRDNYIPPADRGGYALIKNGTEGMAPWLRMNWGELNRMERTIGSLTGDAGRYYSHTLPPFGDQQYYELIGKYQQFYQGWDDADPALVTYDQISFRLQNSPTNMIYYSGERGKANNYYNTASTWVTVAIVNHIVNAVYAGLSAGWYNNAHAEMGMQQVPSEEGFTNVPVVKLRWAF